VSRNMSCSSSKIVLGIIGLVPLAFEKNGAPLELARRYRYAAERAFSAVSP
jgi:hypothetical protein